MRIECRYRAGSHSRARRIRARRQNDGHPGAEHNPGTICLGEIEILRQHVAGLEVGNEQDLCPACDLGFDSLDPRRFHINGVVERQRSVEHAARDLPAIGHFAERRRLDRGRDLGGDGFDRRQDRHARELAKAGLC